MLESGTTTLPKPVREALGVEAGAAVRCFISEEGVQIVKAQSPSEMADILASNRQS